MFLEPSFEHPTLQAVSLLLMRRREKRSAKLCGWDATLNWGLISIHILKILKRTDKNYITNKSSSFTGNFVKFDSK